MRYQPGRLSSGIGVVFISHNPFEPKIKQSMNPRSSDINCSPASETETSAPPETPAVNSPEPMEADAFDGEASASPMLFATTFIGSQPEPNVLDGWSPLENRDSNARPELKLVEFSVDRPAAATVQLAAEFTNWDEAPIDMIRFDDGVWSITVPLPAGTYAYRFLVDGEWYDDPRAVRPRPNSGDPAHAYVQIK